MRIDSHWLDEFQLLDATEKNPAGSPPAKKLSYLLRPAFIAAPGKVLVWGDWSNIEARVLPWLAASEGAELKLDIFRAVDKDPTLPDVYTRTAFDMATQEQRANMLLDELWKASRDKKHPYNKLAKELRQSRGKVPELSLGFGGGIGALIAMGVNYRVYVDVPTAKEVVRKWREANQWAVDFWGKHGRNGSSGLWGAANRAIEQPDTLHEAGRVAFAYDRSYLGGSLFMALPCGRLLTYPRIKWEWREVENKQTKKLEDRYQLTYMKGYGRSAMWYGKFCLAGATLVATDRGWVPLVDVAVSDRVWDGAEWVTHDGLIYQGEEITVPLDGIRMTPDHEVLTVGGWREAKDCDGLNRTPVRKPDGPAAGLYSATWKAGEMGGSLRLWLGKRVPVRRLDAPEQEAIASIVRLSDGSPYQRGDTDARHDAAPGLRGVALNAGPLPAAIASGMAQLRRAWHLGVRALAAFRKLLVRHGAYLQAGVDTGARGQRERLRAGKLQLGDAPRAVVEHAAQPATEHGRAVKADGRSAIDAALPMAREPVYDLVNAGPRARFVVLGASGPMIVHNCENATQATAASILRRTLKRLARLPSDDWMPVVAHVHDEVTVQTDEALESDASAVLAGEMERNDVWDAGLPLKSEVKSNWFVTKAGD